MIQLLQNLETRSASIRFADNPSQFPTSPSIGQLAFVQSVLYIYSDLNGAPSWFPLSTKLTTYTHHQAIAATTWSISHGLGSSDLIWQAYDDQDNVMYANIYNQTSTGFDLVMTSSCIGRVVIFSTGSQFAQQLSTSSLTVGSVTITGSQILVGGVDIVAALNADTTGLAANYSADATLAAAVAAMAVLDGGAF
jgi:hypothetical protein